MKVLSIIFAIFFLSTCSKKKRATNAHVISAQQVETFEAETPAVEEKQKEKKEEKIVEYKGPQPKDIKTSNKIQVVHVDYIPKVPNCDGLSQSLVFLSPLNHYEFLSIQELEFQSEVNSVMNDTELILQFDDEITDYLSVIARPYYDQNLVHMNECELKSGALFKLKDKDNPLKLSRGEMICRGKVQHFVSIYDHERVHLIQLIDHENQKFCLESAFRYTSDQNSRSIHFQDQEFYLNRK